MINELTDGQRHWMNDHIARGLQALAIETTPERLEIETRHAEAVAAALRHSALAAAAPAAPTALTAAPTPQEAFRAQLAGTWPATFRANDARVLAAEPPDPWGPALLRLARHEARR